MPRLVGLPAVRQSAASVERRMQPRLLPLGLVASLCLSACAPWVSQVDTGARLLVNVGYDWKDQACWAPGSSGTVTLTATPVALSGATGAETQQLAVCTIPQYAASIRDSESHRQRFECQCRGTFSGLRVGLWELETRGPAGAAWCLVDLTGQSSRDLTVWHGICRQ
jgi:hypothetical protein